MSSAYLDYISIHKKAAAIDLTIVKKTRKVNKYVSELKKTQTKYKESKTLLTENRKDINKKSLDIDSFKGQCERHEAEMSNAVSEKMLTSLQNEVRYLQKKIRKIEDELEKLYITQDELENRRTALKEKLANLKAGSKAILALYEEIDTLKTDAENKRGTLTSLEVNFPRKMRESVHSAIGKNHIDPFTMLDAGNCCKECGTVIAPGLIQQIQAPDYTEEGLIHCPGCQRLFYVVPKAELEKAGE